VGKFSVDKLGAQALRPHFEDILKTTILPVTTLERITSFSGKSRSQKSFL